MAADLKKKCICFSCVSEVKDVHHEGHKIHMSALIIDQDLMVTETICEDILFSEGGED